jgi:hypothetical protein
MDPDWDPDPAIFVTDLKGIDRPFRGGVESIGTHSIPTGKLEARKFFKSYFKGPSSQDQHKTLRRRLIIFKVTDFCTA